MKERGILFTGRNVRAILDGSKTQTRRLVRLKDHSRARFVGMKYGAATFVDTIADDPVPLRVMNPWGFVPPVLADSPEKLEGVPVRLWVRETWHRDQSGGVWGYYADHDPPRDGFATNVGGRKVPAIHMPRWASRITLEIAEVRVQRLLEITEQDAIAEGVQRERFVSPANAFETGFFLGAAHPVKRTPKVFITAVQAFASRWDEINGKRAPWASNPWVWAITFKKVETTHASDARHSA